MINNENYITIQGFMINDLDLKGNELLIYAIIYGFSQADNQEYKGSLQYLADWCNSTKQGVIKALKSLIDKDLIERQETSINNVKFVSYVTKFNSIKQSLTVLNTVERGIKQSLPNNIDNNIDIIKEKNNIKKENEIIPPTLEMVKKYCDEKQSNVDPERFYNYYEAKGWLIGKTKMKDWHKAISLWERSGYAPKKKIIEYATINPNFEEMTEEEKKEAEELAKKLLGK